MGEWKYVRDGENKFILLDDKNEKIAEPVDRIAFLLDGDEIDATLIKHGSYELVSKRMGEHVTKYREAGLDDMVKNLMVIEVTHVDLEEVNKCISITGYINKFVKAVRDSAVQHGE